MNSGDYEAIRDFCYYWGIKNIEYSQPNYYDIRMPEYGYASQVKVCAQSGYVNIELSKKSMAWISELAQPRIADYVKSKFESPTQFVDYLQKMDYYDRMVEKNPVVRDAYEKFLVTVELCRK